MTLSQETSWAYSTTASSTTRAIQLHNLYFMQPYKKIMKAVLMCSSYVDTFQFSTSHQPSICPSVSDVVFISGGRLFHAKGQDQ